MAHDDHTDHSHHDHSAIHGADASPLVNLRRGIDHVFTKDTRHRTGEFAKLEEALEEIGKRLKSDAKAGTAFANDAHNILEGIEHHIEHMREHHPHDPKLAQEIEELQQSVTRVFDRHAGDPEQLMKELKSTLKKQQVKIPGELIRDPNLPILKEYSAQFSEHMGEKKLFGKVMSFTGATVGLGVVAHGALNMKRGLMGYSDPETGEQRKGALSNIIVGALEMAAGLSSLKRALTGRWGFGHATHKAAHDHHHDHDHGHSH